MPIDPLLTLASAIYRSPGVYALLLGSGISRSAGVPTGWEVVTKLLEQLAALERAAPSDVFEWYRERGGEPDYSKLLEELAPSAGDRQRLLQPHFEATEDERSRGVKQPTAAHKAIARLVSGGWIRVIVTTNFDRLLEQALAEEGVQPVVIADAAAAAGAAPLAHTDCTVIKLHGDYRNPDIRNTVAELEAYEPATDRLLDRVFDDYGLLVCGWSGDWDPALRAAILRAPNRRFTTFWAHRGPLSERASELAEHRAAVRVAVDGADELFTNVESKVQTLGEMQREPLSIELAVAEVKRYLPDPTLRIRLHDLLMDEVTRLSSLRDLPMSAAGHSLGPVLSRMSELERECQTVLPMLVTLAYFADREEHDELIVEVLTRLVGLERLQGGTVVLLDLQRYPAMLALYVAGVAGIARGRLLAVKQSLWRTIGRPGDESPAAVALSSWHVMSHEACEELFERERGTKMKQPRSEYLHRALREPLRFVLPDDDQYDRCFDEWEVLIGAAAALHRGRGPLGRFTYSRREPFPQEVLARHRSLLEALAPADTSVDEAVNRYVDQTRQAAF